MFIFFFFLLKKCIIILTSSSGYTQLFAQSLVLHALTHSSCAGCVSCRKVINIWICFLETISSLWHMLDWPTVDGYMCTYILLCSLTNKLNLCSGPVQLGRSHCRNNNPHATLHQKSEHGQREHRKKVTILNHLRRAFGFMKPGQFTCQPAGGWRRLSCCYCYWGIDTEYCYSVWVFNPIIMAILGSK